MIFWLNGSISFFIFLGYAFRLGSVVIHEVNLLIELYSVLTVEVNNLASYRLIAAATRISSLPRHLPKVTSMISAAKCYLALNYLGYLVMDVHRNTISRKSIISMSIDQKTPADSLFFSRLILSPQFIPGYSS